MACSVRQMDAPSPSKCLRETPTDPMTLARQIDKLKQRFHLDHVVLVGDRGMITQARLTTDIKAAGLDWISSLRAGDQEPVGEWRVTAFPV
jgi:hypothetical protein